jgi:hypothetical protein
MTDGSWPSRRISVLFRTASNKIGVGRDIYATSLSASRLAYRIKGTPTFIGRGQIQRWNGRCRSLH